MLESHALKASAINQKLRSLAVAGTTTGSTTEFFRDTRPIDHLVDRGTTERFSRAIRTKHRSMTTMVKLGQPVRATWRPSDLRFIGRGSTLLPRSLGVNVSCSGWFAASSANHWKPTVLRSDAVAQRAFEVLP
ncbi:MAG: hypothetical protein IPK97_17045 [Ahniella sp.]|nr:hypothetical protein [Ahniella sp.]